MSIYNRNDGSINIDQHMQLRGDPEFKIRFELADIMQAPEVKDMIFSWSGDTLRKDAESHGFELPENVELSRELYPGSQAFNQALKRVRDEERRWKTQRGIDNANRFDIIVNENWKKLMPPGKVPELMIQHRARKRVLMDMRVPCITQDFFYRDYDDFVHECVSSCKSLNDTQGDILSGDYTQFKFELVGIMTDYCGTMNGEDSFTSDKNYARVVLSHKMNEESLIVDATSRGNRVVNFISAVFKNSILKFQNYPQLSLKEPYESDVSYIRHTYLLKGVTE